MRETTLIQYVNSHKTLMLFILQGLTGMITASKYDKSLREIRIRKNVTLKVNREHIFSLGRILRSNYGLYMDRDKYESNKTWIDNNVLYKQSCLI